MENWLVTDFWYSDSTVNSSFSFLDSFCASISFASNMRYLNSFRLSLVSNIRHPLTDYYLITECLPVSKFPRSLPVWKKFSSLAKVSQFLKSYSNLERRAVALVKVKTMNFVTESLKADYAKLKKVLKNPKKSSSSPLFLISNLGRHSVIVQTDVFTFKN